MTNTEGRVVQLELSVNALQQQIAAILSRLVAVEQLARGAQGITYNWNGGGGGTSSSFWAMAPAGGIVPSSGSFPDITPTTVSVTVYESLGGILNAVGIRNVRWWYRDACPQYMLLPLHLSGDGTSYDALGNGCTAVNP